MNRRTDVVQLSGLSWYQALVLTLSGTRPKMTVVDRTSAITPAMSMTTPTGSITCMSASLNCGSASRLESCLASAAGADARPAAAAAVAAAPHCCSLEQPAAEQVAARSSELRRVLGS